MRRSPGIIAGGVVMASALMMGGVASAATKAPVPNPPTPTTQLDAIVDDVSPGLHFVPDKVRAGNVNITLHDRRSNPTGTLHLRSYNAQFPIDITGDGGTQSTSVSRVDSYHIVAQIDGTDPPCCVGDQMLPVLYAGAAVAEHSYVELILDEQTPCAPGQQICRSYGAHLVPDRIPAGLVQIKLRDERPVKTGEPWARTGTSYFPVDLSGDGDVQETRVQAVEDYWVLAGPEVSNPVGTIASGLISVQVPTMAAANDPAFTITLDVQAAGIVAPSRENGVVEPKLYGLPPFLPIARGRWCRSAKAPRRRASPSTTRAASGRSARSTA